MDIIIRVNFCTLRLVNINIVKEQKNIIVKIKSTNLELTPVVEDYARTKINMLQKFLKHYADQSGELIFDIEIGKTTEHHRKGDIFRAEINFTAGGTLSRAVAEEANLYAAIDKAKDEMQRELRRNKNKALVAIRRGGARLKQLLRRG